MMKPSVRTDTIIECVDACKTYELSSEHAATLKELVLHGGRSLRRRRMIQALKHINLNVRRGEIVGLIGDNGSGKSTMLKLIAGITNPTSGHMRVNGTVASLLELGVGFHPDMTGRENVFLSGALLGISQEELERRMADIIAFSELENFIDAPVKHYSSGMYLRLGFAIGIHVNPDILLVDEILAVGDQRFQQKCKEHIRGLRQSGKTIFFVSHDLDSILGLCSRAVVLNRGEILGDGVAHEMISLYKQHLFEESRARGEAPPVEISHRNRFGTFEVAFIRVRMFDREGRERYVYETGEYVRFEYTWRASQRIAYPVFGMSIMTDQGEALYMASTDVTLGDVEYIEGEGTVSFEIENLNLLEGFYSLSYSITRREDGPGSSFNFYEGYDFVERMCPFMVRPGRKGVGLRGHVYFPCRSRVEVHGHSPRIIPPSF